MTDTRGRANRQSEVAAQRRRRDDTTLDAGRARKLAIPRDIEKQLAAQGRTARWVNDVGSRISDLTERDDWDKVEGVAPRTVKIDRNGDTAQAYLISKPNAFIAEDEAKKDAGRRLQEEAMLKGEVPGSTPAPNTYVPKGNRMERGNQII